MAVDLSGLINEAIQRMYEQASNDSIKELQNYQSRIQNAQAKIKAFKLLDESELLSNSQINWETSDKNFLTDNYKNEASATKIMETDTYRIAYGKALLDGYHVLTEFGSYIRNSGEVKYSVTATGGKGSGTYKITWTDMPFEQFADLVNFNVGQHIASFDSKKHTGGQAIIEGLRLKGVAKLFKEKLNQNNNEDQIFAWDSAQIQLYEDFVKRAKNLRIDGKRKWYKANEGNFLEAFTRFLENTNGNMAHFSSKGKLSNLAYQQIREAMEQTMSNPGAFYTGGDIGNLQLKGNAATISQASTIENMLNTTNILLSNIISMAYNVQASLPGGIAQSINNSVEQTIKETIEELVKLFFNI